MKSLLQKSRQLFSETGGQEIAEAAVVLPLLFMILLAILSFGRAYNVYSTIVRAAQDGAELAATGKCGMCASTPAADDTNVLNAVTSAMTVSKVSTDQIIAYTPTPAPLACPGLAPAGCTTDGGTNITICRNVELNPNNTSGPQRCGSIVSFRYPYRFSIPFASINLQSLQLTAVGERQMEN